MTLIAQYLLIQKKKNKKNSIQIYFILLQPASQSLPWHVADNFWWTNNLAASFNNSDLC